MGRIRNLYYFDKKYVQEMISFLNNGAGDIYIKNLMFNPITFFHHFLPLNLKFLPESFILKDNRTVKGLITVAPGKCPSSRIEIQKLFFEENSYSEASELVQYVVSKYKAMGTGSIIVRVDDYHSELLSMFVQQCGFTQISYEKLWQIEELSNFEYNKNNYRDFRYSDKKTIANLYNDSLLPHYRPLLSKQSGDYNDNCFHGLSYYSEFKYTIQDSASKKTIGAIIITTYDNENYIIDIIQNIGCELDIFGAISFASDKIKKRKKDFKLFIKSKKYTQLGEKYENIFMEHHLKCVQNQIVLTNSTARILKNPQSAHKYTVLGDFRPTNIVLE